MAISTISSAGLATGAVGSTQLASGAVGTSQLATSPTITTPTIAQINSASSGTPTVFADSAGTQVGTLCRAWVNFAGASGTRNASFNVSSVTRSTTGQYVVNFAVAMSDANYSAVAACSFVSSGTSNSNIDVPAQTTSSVTVFTGTGGWGGYSDATFVSVAVFR